MARSKTKDEVLSKLDIKQEARRLGIEVVKERGIWLDCKCPLHEDDRPSFSIATEADGDHEKGWWVCQAENRSGSLFDLAIALGAASDFRSSLAFFGGANAVRRSGSRPGSGSPVPNEPAPDRLRTDPVVTGSEVQRAQASLREEDEALKYLREERGLSMATIEALRIGWVTDEYGRGSIVLPKPAGSSKFPGTTNHFKHLPFPRPTRESGTLRFFHTKGGDTHLLYPMEAPPITNGELVPVVESELDAAFIIDCGTYAAAVGGTSHFKAEALKPIYELGGIPLLMPDVDKHGIAAFEKCLAKIKQLHLSYALIVEPYPSGCKDIGDIVKEHGREAAKEWLQRAFDGAQVMHPLRGSPEVWKRLKMDYGRNGEELGPLRALENLDVILAHDPRWAGRLWMNSMGRVRMLNENALTDDDFSDIRAAIQLDYGIDFGSENVHERVRSICRKNARSPVVDYLNGLKWDGVPRLDHMVGTIFTLSTEQDLELKKVYLRKFMIGAVARALSPGCKMDTMLVLYSKQQGIGKSRFAAALAGAWFCDESIRPDDRDCKLALHKHWIVEVSELDATTRRRDLAELRAFISRREDLIRAPYGRCDEVFHRAFVFLGTTNDQAVVKEEDGRRYWPIEVTAIDVDEVHRQRDQLWAEARERFLAGEEWWLSSESEGRRREDTEKRFTDEDSAVESIHGLTQEPGFSGLTIDRIMGHWKECGIAVSRKEAPALLRKAGLESVREWSPIGAPREHQRLVRKWTNIRKSST